MVEPQSKAITTSDNTEIDKTFELLEEGEKNIVLREEYKDLILVLGNTGSGKSTFIQWLMGDNSKLMSIEVEDDTFIVEDGNNRIGRSSVNSKTTFPELVIDNRTNTAYYDCSGFGDTRSTSHDISSTYFIKKLTDHATNVKIILTVSYASVRVGYDRVDFMKLLRHVTDLIKNLKNFQNSIAIAITKVDNTYKKVGNTLSLVPDDKIIKSVGEFMQEIKQGLEDKLNIPDSSNKDQIAFYNNAIELLDVLLKQNNNQVYSRIGIFRRPDEPGPLSNIVLLQKGKTHIEKIIHQEIKFTKKINTDFGFTISEKSKNDINKLVAKINDKVRNNISAIVDKIIKYLENLETEMRKRINSFINVNAINFDVGEIEANNFATKLNDISLLLTEVKNLTCIEELGNKLNITITNLGINTSTENIKNVIYQGKVFNFLQNVSDVKINTVSWLDLFYNIDISIINLKDRTEKSTLRAATKVNAAISNHLTNIAKQIEKHYLNKMETWFDIEKLLTELNKSSTFMSNLTQQIRNVRNAQDLSEKITKYIINDDSAIKTDTLRILYYSKFLESLKVLNNKVVDTWKLESVNSFDNTAKYLSESETWYKFLFSLNARLSEYDIQQNKMKYNVANLNDWGLQDKPKGIQIDKNNFNLFLEKIKNYDISKYNDVKNIEITQLQLQELNKVLDIKIKKELDIQCPKPGELLIKGDYIKFSDFVNADGFVEDICGDRIAITSVDIFSVDTIFIDRDFRGSGSQISIVAPKWEIIGRRTINLNGASADAYESKAANGLDYSQHGSDGQPGLPGAAGGNFLGIGREFINGKDLFITANGGQGGDGQTGGDGKQGEDGESAKTNDEFEYVFLSEDNLVKGLSSNTVKHYRYFGKPGADGGNGGDGGAGGLGGINGEIKILKMNNSSDLPSVENISGSVGTDGSGGIGGQGGKYGDNLKASYCQIYVALIPMKPHWCSHSESFKSIIEPNDNRGKSGSDGIKGQNTQDRQQPESPREFKNVSNFVNDYKKYLLDNLENRHKNKLLLNKFFIELNSNSDIKNYSDTLGLITELQNLEEKEPLHRLNSHVDFLPFYQALLNKISEYAQRPNQFESSDEYKKVLINLYTATLSKISTLKSFKKYSEPNLIIDLDNYLSMVEKNIKHLTNLHDKNNKVELISKYKDNYKSNIDRKIREAQNIIRNEIEPEIENIGSQLEDKISLLINETVRLKKEFKDEKERLFKKKQELQNALNTDWIFTAIQFVGHVVDSFGRIGTVVAEVITVASQIAEPLLLNYGSKESIETLKSVTGVISNIQSSIKSIQEVRKQEFTNFNNRLENIYTELNKHDELNDTSEKVKNIMTKNQEAQENSDVSKIQDLKEELKQELIKKEESLKNQGDNGDNKNTTAVLHTINHVMQLGMLGLDLYNRYKSDKETSQAIDESLKAAKDKIQKIEQQEDKMYATMIPMLKKSEDELKNIITQLNNKSPVTLDLTQWKVKSFLKDINHQMRQLTKEFDIEEDLSRCIDKLEESMITLINVYDRIQKYQEQKQLSAYIADISSATASNIIINNQTLNNAVQKLEVIVTSNLVLEQYKTVTDALAQQVFPFAPIYLTETMLPSHFQLEGNFENLVNNAVDGVNRIRTKITEYKTAVKNGHDRYISSGLFDGDHMSTQPFFVWENHKHSNEISKILSGQKVMLKANILNSPFDKDAIKFNVIGINFRSKNSTLTSEIHEKLDAFKVSMTHLGNSYYRYNSNVYVITSDRQEIQYSFEKENGEPIHSNSVYKKIRLGDLMLSPYAMWEIQLINSVPTKCNFKELSEYTNYVDLELEGSGSYLSTGTNISSIHMENYYNAAETISDISNSIQNEPLPPTSIRYLSNIPADRRRKRRNVLPSSAASPTSWMTRLRRGILPIFSIPLLSESSKLISPCPPGFTTENLHGGLQLLDLIVRKWTKQNYPQSPPTISDLDYAEMCVQAAETVETELKENHVASNDFERYQDLLANKPLPGYSYNPRYFANK